MSINRYPYIFVMHLKMKNKYQYNATKENYEDYSSGRVLYGASGATNFPVRLASEIFQRCATYLQSKGNVGPYNVFDPFCGVGYSLTVVGFLHGAQISSITASDADSRMLEFAEKNISLLNKAGLGKRVEELNKFIREYNKNSHRDAVDSARKLEAQIKPTSPIGVKLFKFNVLDGEDFPKSVSGIDIVITDIPYGKLTEWKGEATGENFTQRFLDKLKPTLGPVSIVAVIRDKKQAISHVGYEAIQTFALEKRKITLLMLY